MASRDDLDAYYRREAAATQQLRSELGDDVVGKLDRVTLRDLIAARREDDLDDLFRDQDDDAEAEPLELRVLVNLTTGRAAARTPQAESEKRAARRRRRDLADTVRERSDVRRSALEQHLSERDGDVEDWLWLTHSAVVVVSPDRVVSLAGRADVASITHTKQVFAIALDVSRPLIQADQVETGLGVTGRNIQVAVLDTGVDFTKAALTPVQGTSQDFTGEGVGDGHGHGSHCAGIVASNHDIYRGVAPGATVHEYKMLNSAGSTDAPTAVSAIQAAVADGMDVLSNSWGFSHQNGNWVDPDGTCVLCTAADNAAALGSVFVVAGGNEDQSTCGTFDTWLRCPGIAEDALTVGASDDNDTMAGFSSRGPTPDGRCKPDVTAPGVDIMSVRATGTSMGSPLDADFTEASGTSMACPHVAGLAALMLERNTGLIPNAIKFIVMGTAIPIGADVCTEQGAGRIDALSAVNAA